MERDTNYVARIFHSNFLERRPLNRTNNYLCRAMKKLLSSASPLRRKYLSEKNALTVMASMFCFAMMVVAFGKQAWLECAAFALAFSFSVEIICHRAKEKN